MHPTEIRRYCSLLWLALLALWLLSQVFVHDLPDGSRIVSRLQQEPVQEETDRQPFTIERKGITYTVTPLYTYQIQGLVVSTHHANSLFDYMHYSWQDHLNIKDICMVWGENVQDGLYQYFSFSSGDFTCFFQTKDYQAWQDFNLAQISNNHILTADHEVAQTIMQASVGDQIMFRGYLVNYSHSGTFSRSTSTTRFDTGNGACETVFVEDFTILKRENAFWHGLSFITGWGCVILGAGLLVWLVKDFFFTRRLTAEQYFELAKEAIMDGNMRTALRELNLALDGNPEMAKAYQLRAAIHERLGNYKEAHRDNEIFEHLEREKNAPPDRPPDFI